MNKTLHLRVVSILLLLAATQTPLLGTTFFADNFSTGSTLNQTPVLPTGSSTSYELASSKTWTPAPTLGSGDLKFGIAATTSGSIEVQALFTNTPIALTTVGDYIQLTVVFTNTAGLMTSNNTLMAFGLYNSGGSFPVAGGLNATAVNGSTDHAEGGVKGWAGYVGQMATSNNNSRIMTRAAQTGTDNRNQDLVTSGSGSSSYGVPGAATVGASSLSPVILVTGARYTVVFTITLTAENTLAITNSLYDGPDTTGTLLTQFGGTASGGTFLTSGFDGFAIGWRDTAGAGLSKPTTIDISSLMVSGEVTAITTPPEITSQPVPVTVPSGASCAFSVAATGVNLTYQWHRNGTNLLNGGNISGVTSDLLVISPAVPADVASGANGYYVTVSGAGNLSATSTTNSLALGTASSLIWSGSGSVWDVGTTSDWLKSGSPAVFNFGDTVTFDDTGVANPGVTLANRYLSAASVVVNASISTSYFFSGPGSFAGPGQLQLVGPGLLSLANTNTYSGGTLISNDQAFLVVSNYNGLGTGPITLAKAGGQMQIFPAGSASFGINGDIIVADDFAIIFESTSPSFGAVLFGNLSGTPNKTLTINHVTGTAPSRIRIYGTNTVYDGNLNLTDSKIVWSFYQPSGSQTYNGVISGPGALIQRGNGTTILKGANTYTGGTTPTVGAIGFGIDTVGGVTAGPIGTGPLFLAPEAPNLTGSGSVFAFGGARTIANPIQYPSATNNQTLIIGGTNNLTFTGPFTLNGSDSLGTLTNRTLQVTNTALTTFSGVISDGGLGFGLIKTGNGILALDNVETYSGTTGVSNGTLRVNGQIAGAVTVGTNATLGGTGTVNGQVTVLAGGAIAPGSSIGTLTINNSLSLAGNLNIEINKSAGTTSDRVNVSGTLNNTGTGRVAVTNLGSSLVPGDSFTLFNKAVVNGNALTITGGQVNWTNKLAIDGTIAVLSAVPTTPTNISFAVSGNSLTLSWPLSHLGWSLQSNSVGIASSGSWFAVANTSTSTNLTITLDPSKTNVFYRLFYTP